MSSSQKSRRVCLFYTEVKRHKYPWDMWHDINHGSFRGPSAGRTWSSCPVFIGVELLPENFVMTSSSSDSRTAAGIQLRWSGRWTLLLCTQLCRPPALECWGFLCGRIKSRVDIACSSLYNPSSRVFWGTRNRPFRVWENLSLARGHLLVWNPSRGLQLVDYDPGHWFNGWPFCWRGWRRWQGVWRRTSFDLVSFRPGA